MCGFIVAMSNHTRLSIFLISLTLAACGTRTATPTPTVVPLPSVTPPAQQASATPTVMPIPSIAPQTSNGLTLRADNFRYTDYRPNKHQFSVDVCYQRPDSAEWFIPKAQLQYPNGVTALASANTLTPATCLALHFYVPITADLISATLTLPALVSYPAPETICADFYPAVQKALDSQNTGVTVHCEQGELGPLVGPWIYPDTLTRADAQQLIDAAWQQVIDRDYSRLGPWVFTTSAIPYLAPLTLSDSATRPPLPPLTVNQAQYTEGRVLADVCYQPPSAANWGVWLATLESGSTEIDFDGYDHLTHPTPDAAGRQCDTVSFSGLPPDFDLAHAELNVFALGAPPLDEAEGCGPYLQQLQTTLAARYPGLTAACGHADWGWYLQATHRPDYLTEQQAAELVYSDDLYTLKGWFQFPVHLNP